MPTSAQHARRVAALLAITAAFLQGCPSGSPTPGNPIKPIDVTKSDMTDEMDMPSDMTTGMPVDMMEEPDLAVDMPEEVDEAPDLACEQESTLQFCMRYAYSCGELTAEDNCGDMRTEVCGEMCTLPQTCVPEVNDEDMVSSQSCICNFDNVVEVCDRVGKLCGPLAPPCEGMVCDNFCVDSVASGANFNCAIGSGNLRCWGENGGGQLGQGNKTGQKNPVPVDIPLKVTSIATGEDHSCAILDDTSLICWGSNAFGQLGVSTTVDQPEPDLTDPNSRAFARGVAKVTLNKQHTCALVDDDFDPVNDSAPKAPYSAYCWGSNETGAIGNTDVVLIGTDAGTPIKVKGLTDNVIDISAGFGHTCAIIDEGDPANRTVRCWGLDDGGQIGTRDLFSAQLYSLKPNGERDTNGAGDDILSGYYHHYLNSRENREYVVIPAPAMVRTDAPATQVSNAPVNNDSPTFFTGAFEQIVTGRRSSCVRDNQGSVYCWGALSYDDRDNSCELVTYYDETTTYAEHYANDPNANIQKLLPDRCSVWPLPDDWEGPTVTMLNDLSGRPSKYGLPGSAVIIRAVAARPLKLRHHPDDPGIHPPYLTGGEDVNAKQISLYEEHVCMLLDDDAFLPGGNSRPAFSNVYCFGMNENGQLGNGTNSPQSYPMELTKDINALVVRAQEVDTGINHSCAVADNNNILCWGSNKNGQLGNENLAQDESFRPFDVLLR